MQSVARRAATPTSDSSDLQSTTGSAPAQGFDLDGFLGGEAAVAQTSASRIVTGGDHYKYEQFADGTIKIINGKGGTPLVPPKVLAPSDPVNAAITAELTRLHGPFPAEPAPAAPAPTPATPAPGAAKPDESASLIPSLDDIVAGVGGMFDGFLDAIGFGDDVTEGEKSPETAPAEQAPAGEAPSSTAELDELLAQQVLTTEQIQQARALIAKLPSDQQGPRYLTLQEKVAYANQRDNESDQEESDGGTCNFTAIAMALTNLGVPNPDPSRQFEDVLVEKAGKRDITLGSTWDAVAGELGVQMETIANIVDVGTIDRPAWESIRDKHLAAGKGVILSLRGHVIRLQGVTEDGLVVDDPYGKSTIAADARRDRKDSAGNVTEADSKYNWEKNGINSAEGGAGGENGNNVVYPWEDVKGYIFGAVFAFSK